MPQPDLPEGRQLITFREKNPDQEDEQDLELDGYGCVKPVSMILFTLLTHFN